MPGPSSLLGVMGISGPMRYPRGRGWEWVSKRKGGYAGGRVSKREGVGMHHGIGIPPDLVYLPPY